MAEIKSRKSVMAIDINTKSPLKRLKKIILE